MNEDERKVNIKNIVAKIPLDPGIYMMRDIEDKVIYVGKAISLRKRVKQYFQKNLKSQRIEKMTNLVHNITYIVTNNEVEALVLECNYIKQFAPKFNVLLKDDKTYPYIKVTVNEKYPTIYITRTKKEDKAIYFGPYTNVKAVRDVLAMIKQIFPVKRCKYDLSRRKVQPCLYYHIGRCVGPCINDVSLDTYKQMINQIILFLQGKTKEVENLIKLEIEKCINSLEFEKANQLKERLENIKSINEKQNVSNLNEVSSDIFGYVYNLQKLFVQVFKIRDYKVVLNDNFEILDIDKTDVNEVLTQIISQYYQNNKDIPKKVYMKLDEEKTQNILEEYISNVKGSNVLVYSPKKGEKLKLIEMVENNIKINIEQSKDNAIDDFRDLLGISGEVNSIECFDISNLRNEYIVGSLIRYEDNKLNKKMYRKFKVKSALEQNDPLSIYEILSRRLKHIEDWPLPDVILIDGGKTQIAAAKKALEESGESIDIFGMIKNDKHKTRGLVDIKNNEYNLTLDENRMILKFITFLQDEVHRFTISYHRSLRDKIK